MLNHEKSQVEKSDQTSIFSKFESIKKLIIDNQLQEARDLVIDLHPADLSDLIDSLSTENAEIVLSIIEADFNPEILVLLSSRSISQLVQIYGSERLASFVSGLSVIDAIEFMDELDDNIKSEILELLPEENRLHILEGFNYDEHTAGRVMSKKYVLFNEHWSVEKAIESIRKNENIPDEFHAVVVVNAKNKPVGTVTLSKVLKEKRSVEIREIMNTDFKVTDTNTSLSDLSYIFKHYALTVVPVINKSGKIVGTISIDNMIFIIEEQAEDALLHFGGVNEIDIYDTFTTAAKQRFPWLFINLIAACITSVVISNFTPIIEKIIALATLMPIVSSIGGNAGTQTMTMTIMAITNKDTSRINNLQLIIKEFLTCGINGFIFALLGSIFVFWIFQDLMLAKVFGLAIVINFLIGGVLGSAVPIFIDRMKQDPAPSSGVIVTAITDSCGFLIFLGLAKLMLIG